VIRAGSNVSALAASATRIVRRIAPTALIEDVVTIQEYKDRSVSNQRLNAALISAFGALALVVAAVGIGGVLAFSVSARTNEIGIRMSLGADRGIIERMILREGGTLVVTGLLLGVTGAFFAGRVVRGMLFGISPNDPVTLVTAARPWPRSGSWRAGFPRCVPRESTRSSRCARSRGYWPGRVRRS